MLMPSTRIWTSDNLKPTTQTAAQRRGRLGVHVSGGFPESSAALAFVASVDSRTLPAAQPAE